MNKPPTSAQLLISMVILALVSVPWLYLEILAYEIERSARYAPGVSPPWLSLRFIEMSAAMEWLWPLVFVALTGVVYWMHKSCLRVLKVHAVVAVCLVAVMFFLMAMCEAQMEAVFARSKEYWRTLVELKQLRY